MGRKKLTDEEKAARKAERDSEKAKDKTQGTASAVDEKTVDDKKKMLLEKAKKLAEKVEVKVQAPEKKIETEKVEEIKAEKKEDKKSNTLIPLDDYVKAGCYIGTKVITPDMRKFVYRRRADGIAIINTNIIDEKIREGVKFLVQFKPNDFVVVCKREAGWRAVKLFSELTGVKVFTKKYPAGVITNLTLPDFFETEMVFICDPWLDKNALNDAWNIKKKTMGICDTNNLSRGIDMVIPANNKSNKSLGVIFYILAREYMKAHGIDKKLPSMEEFIGEKLEELPARKTKAEKAAEKEKAQDIEKIESILKVVKEE